jgi:hypothetical protein
MDRISPPGHHDLLLSAPTLREPNVLEAELVPMEPGYQEPTAGPSSVPGPPVAGNLQRKGRKPGSLNKVGSELKARLAEELTAHPESNPLLTLLHFSTNPDLKPALRIIAADKLCRYLAPHLMSLSVPDEEEKDYERETTTILERLRKVVITKEKKQ